MNTPPSTLLQNFKKAKQLNGRHKFAESNKVLDGVIQAPGSDKKFLAEVLSLVGDNNFNLGNYQLCLQQFMEAERIFKELKQLIALAEAENNLGAIYKRLGLHAHALFKNLESLTYTFQTNEQYTMTSSLMNAAASLFDTGFTDKAFRALDAALLVCDKHTGDPKYEEMRMVVLNNKATFYSTLKNWPEMLPLLKQAKAIAIKYKLEHRHNLLDSNMVSCLIKMARYEEAYVTLQAIIKKRKNERDDHYIVDLFKMGTIQKEYFKNDDKFLEYVNKAIKLAESKNLVSRQISFYSALKEYYTGVNNLAEAQSIDKKLGLLELQENMNKQTGGLEQLFDTNLLVVENMLREKKEKPEFLNRYDYLTGTYPYTQHGVTRHVLLSEIAFCEIRGNYLFIHNFIKTSTGQMILEEAHRVRKTMKEFIAEISTSEAFFARIHNSFIVNLHWVAKDAIKGDSIMIGDRDLKISDGYRSSFKEKLNAFLESELVPQ